MAIFKDGVLFLTTDKTVVSINKGASDILECGPLSHELPLNTLLPEHPLDSLIDTCITEKTPQEHEFQSTWTEKPKHLSVRAEPFVLNEQAGVYLLIRDLTAVKRLEAIEKEFITNVSHELRTPLTSIKMAAESLQMGAIASPKLKEKFLSNIQREADRLTRLVNELIVLANVEDAKTALHLSHFDMFGVLDDVIHTMQHHSKVNDIELVADFPQNLPVVEADRDRLLQVLINLVDNAIKCNRPNGSVTLHAHAEADSVVIHVVDTGIGIPKIDLHRIFDRFFRVDKARSRVTGGTGLGLSIVKDLIEAHGGEISVESTLDVGTTFIIHLPLKAKVAEPE